MQASHHVVISLCVLENRVGVLEVLSLKTTLVNVLLSFWNNREHQIENNKV